jgi:hypothetical protein
MISPTERVFTAYTLSGDELVPDTGETSDAAAAPAPAAPVVVAPATGETEDMLKSAIWQWEQTLYSDDTLVTAADPSRYLLEFLADKIPWIDSLWDAIHTLVRPLGAAVIAVVAPAAASPLAYACDWVLRVTFTVLNCSLIAAPPSG